MFLALVRISWVVNDNLDLGRYWLSICVLDTNVCDKSNETFDIAATAYNE
jgi:hypothetical protein